MISCDAIRLKKSYFIMEKATEYRDNLNRLKLSY